MSDEIRDELEKALWRIRYGSLEPYPLFPIEDATYGLNKDLPLPEVQ